MTNKELRDWLSVFPDNHEIRIISQHLSNKYAEIVDTDIENIVKDENNDIIYIEIGDFDERE